MPETTDEETTFPKTRIFDGQEMSFFAKPKTESEAEIKSIIIENYSRPTLVDLPSDIRNIIGSFLDPFALVTAERAGFFYKGTNREVFWKQHVYNEITTNPKLPKGMTYKQFYSHAHKIRNEIKFALEERRKELCMRLFTTLIVRGYDKLAPLLIDKIDVNAVIDEISIESNSLLHVAVFHRSDYFLNLLLEKGAKVDVIGPGFVREGKYSHWRPGLGSTPLMLAAEQGYESGLTILIKNQAKVNFRDESTGKRPLHEAAANGHVQCVNLLIAAGANVNFINLNGDIPLHTAVRNGHFACVKYLIEHGSTLDQPNNEGYYPIHLAENHLGCYAYLKNEMQKQNISIPPPPGILYPIQRIFIG